MGAGPTNQTGCRNREDEKAAAGPPSPDQSCRQKWRHNKLADLPAGVHLQPGELRIEFNGAQELLERLYKLSQAISTTTRRLREICE